MNFHVRRRRREGEALKSEEAKEVSAVVFLTQVLASHLNGARDLHLVLYCLEEAVEAMGVSKESVETTLTAKLKPTHLVRAHPPPLWFYRSPVRASN